MSTTANRVIKNTGFLYAKMGITMFISLYTTRLILNSLGASDFGIFNIVGGAIGMLGFLNAAMASATQRFMSYSEGAGNKEKQKSIFNISIVLHFGIAVVVGIALLVAGYVFFNGILNIPEGRENAAKVVYGSLVVSTVLTITAVPYDAILNAHENMRYYAVVGVFESSLKLMVAFICVYASYDKLMVYGILMACIPLITLSIMRIYCHKKYEECILSPLKYYDKTMMREMTGFAGWNLFSTSAAMITNNGVGVVMNIFFGPVINAAQGIANQLSGQLMSITAVIVKAISPVITKSEGAHEHKKALLMAETSSKILFFMTSLIVLPTIINISDILYLWLNNVPDYCAFFAAVQLMIFLCEQLTSGYGTAINATGRIKGISVMKSIFKFLYLPLSYVLFKSGFSVIFAYCCLFVIQGLVNGLILPIYYSDRILQYSKKKYMYKMLLPMTVTTLIVSFTGYMMTCLFVGTISIAATYIVCTIVNTICFCFIILTKREYLVLNGLWQTVKLRLFNKC